MQVFLLVTVLVISVDSIMFHLQPNGKYGICMRLVSGCFSLLLLGNVSRRRSTKMSW